MELKIGLNIPQQRTFSSDEKRSLVLALVRGGLGLPLKFAQYVTIPRATMRQFTRYFGSMGLHVQLQMRLPNSVCTASSTLRAQHEMLHLLCLCFASAPATSSSHALSQPCGALQARMQGHQFAHDTQRAVISNGYRIMLGAGTWQVTGFEALARVSNAQPQRAGKEGLNRHVQLRECDIWPVEHHAAFGRLQWRGAGSGVQWRDVCYRGGSAHFDTLAATVACRELGYRSGTIYNAFLPSPCTSFGGCGRGPMYPFIEF